MHCHRIEEIAHKYTSYICPACDMIEALWPSPRACTVYTTLVAILMALPAHIGV